MERVNNASWCCDKIEELIIEYKNKVNFLKNKNNKICSAQAFVYLRIIYDLEKILYGE